MNKYDEGIIISKERYDELIRLEENQNSTSATFDIWMWHELPPIFIEAAKTYYRNDCLAALGIYRDKNQIHFNIKGLNSDVEKIKNELGKLIAHKNKNHLNNLYKLESKAKYINDTLQSDNIKEMNLFQLIKWWFKNRER